MELLIQLLLRCEPTTAITGFSVTVNPNPVASFFNLSVNTGDNHTPVDIRIFNTDGKVISTQKVQPNSTQKIAAEKWKSGVYFVEVTQGDQRRVLKLVKTIN